MCEKRDISENADGGYCIELTNSLLILAEKELAAFIGAVDELFGPQQARQSAFDWIEELELKDLRGQSIPDWRQATLGASARLGALMSGQCSPVVTASKERRNENVNPETRAGTGLASGP